YDFAIQAFRLALDSCPEGYSQTRADILRDMGITYFNKAMRIQDNNPANALEDLLTSSSFLKESLTISNNIYCLDEYARCSYHLGDNFQFIFKNEKDLEINEKEHPELYKIFQ